MRASQVRHTDLGMTKLLVAFAVLSIVLVGALAVAPALSYFTEWRDVQERYNALAARAGRSGVQPGIQQIWKPDLGVTDRCTSCHVGMGDAGAVPGDDLFGAHPDVGHDAADYGCTVCHGGQGRATNAHAAHGFVEAWDDPILAERFYGAGCGSCHTHLRVPSWRIAERGRALFKRYDCGSCHAVDGVGGRDGGPDLTFAGYRGFQSDWHPHHFRRHELAVGGPWASNYGDVPPGDVAAMEEYLRSRFGGSKLAEAKTLAHRLGCRGCHKINGVGGDDGPDLTSEGRRLPADLDSAGVTGPRTLPNWLREHFLDPIGVVAGSRMPDLGLSDADADLLTFYMMSLRPLDVPARYWPADRLRAARLGEREFATDGESLFGVFCAACHGPQGRGRRFGSLDVAFPGIGNPGFLAIASDTFLATTLQTGRPDRRMPAWGMKDGGLRGSEIDSIIAYLRTIQPEIPQRRAEWALPPGDATRGREIFERTCAGCHGARGEGTHAPQLANEAFQAAATDDFLAATIALGREGTPMPAFAAGNVGFAQLARSEIADVVAFVRTLAPIVTRPAATEGSAP